MRPSKRVSLFAQAKGNTQAHLGDEDVFGLEVAVDDATSVQIAQCADHLGEDQFCDVMTQATCAAAVDVDASAFIGVQAQPCVWRCA